jgi:hypothetical protein
LLFNMRPLAGRRLVSNLKAAEAALEEKQGELDQALAEGAEGTRKAEALCGELKRRCDELDAERAQREALAEHLAATRLEAKVR